MVKLLDGRSILEGMLQAAQAEIRVEFNPQENPPASGSLVRVMCRVLQCLYPAYRRSVPHGNRTRLPTNRIPR